MLRESGKASRKITLLTDEHVLEVDVMDAVSYTLTNIFNQS